MSFYRNSSNFGNLSQYVNYVKDDKDAYFCKYNDLNSPIKNKLLSNIDNFRKILLGNGYTRYSDFIADYDKEISILEKSFDGAKYIYNGVTINLRFRYIVKEFYFPGLNKYCPVIMSM